MWLAAMTGPGLIRRLRPGEQADGAMFFKTDNSPDARPGHRLRKIIGAVLAIATGAAGALYVLALINPWRLIVLDKYFGNPLWGMFVVSVAAYVVLRLLLPVDNEAIQRVRLRVRVVPLVTAVVGLVLWGIVGAAFNYTYHELVRSDDGDRAIGLVTRVDDRQHAHVWVGEGLLMRDVGDIGHVCGVVTAEFVSGDLVQISSTRSSDTWEIELDPVTAEPRQQLGPGCSDGPEPVE